MKVAGSTSTRKLLILIGLLAMSAAPSRAQLAVSLTPSQPSPALVGKLVTWTAAASGSSGPYWFRFRVGPADGVLHVVKDFGPENTLIWTNAKQEGSYSVEATARNLSTGEIGTASSVFRFDRIAVNGPTVRPTNHPLVFLYSAPPCEAGSRMMVTFADSGSRARQATPAKTCDGAHSMNFYLAGLQANTAYTARHAVMRRDRITAQGESASFSTGDLMDGLAARNLDLIPMDRSAPVLLQVPLFTNPIATDLEGNIIWYYPGNLSLLTRPEEGGLFWGLNQNQSEDQSHQTIVQFDLAGMTTKQTNAARVSEQLTAMGKRPISSFHHEVRRLPNGNILALAAEEQMLTDVQGPGPADVLGDVIVVLDDDLNVVWSWDSFDHLDPNRAAVLNEPCTVGVCAPWYLAPKANDWLHGNAVQETPDGNLLYSIRHQDWIVKIDYRDGRGTGNILWRLGPDGDFQVISSDPSPWFSHQHDPNLLSDNQTMVLFDNGNTRNASDPSANSRGQVWTIDEQNRVATLQFSQDLGVFSIALGSAQKLLNGNIHFDVGYLPDSTSQAIELDAQGNKLYQLHVSAPEYRSFRMKSLYSIQ